MNQEVVIVIEDIRGCVSVSVKNSYNGEIGPAYYFWTAANFTERKLTNTINKLKKAFPDNVNVIVDDTRKPTAEK